MTLSRNGSESSSPAQLIRDLTLSPEAPLAFCLRLLLQQLMWMGRSEQLFELFGPDPRQMDLVEARNLLLRLGYGSTQERLQSWDQLQGYSLPALYLTPEQHPYVLSRDGQGLLLAANADGRVGLADVPVGGSLVVFYEAPPSDRVALVQQVLYRFRHRISLLYGISFALALLALVVPFYIRAVYNIVIPSENLFTGAWLFLGVLLLFGLDWTLRQWRSSQLAQLAARLDALLGVKLIEKTIGLDSNQTETLGTRSYRNRQRNLDALLVYLQGPLALALLDFPFVLLYLGAIALIAGPLVLIPLVLMGITAILVLVMSRYYGVAADLSLSSEIGIAQAQQELVSRFLEVKQSSLEWVWLQRLRGLSAQSTSSALTINRQLGRLQVVVSTASQLAGVLTLAFGVWLASNSEEGAAAMGTLIAAMFFVWRVFTPFQQLMNAMLRLSSMRKQFAQLDQFFKLRQSTRMAAESPHHRLYGSVLLDSGTCRLGRDSSLALTRVSLSVEPGQILALTGKAGCGKSAVLRVIDQLYPLSNGSLLFDGVDYRQFSPDLIQSNIAFVMERSELLPGTVLSNLMAMNPDVTPPHVRSICERIGILDYLESLPDGLDTSLDEAFVYQLPHGVLRLFSLAQALIKDTPILLIDDLSQGLSPDQFQIFLEALPSFRVSFFSGHPRSVVIATDNRLLLEKVDQLCILDKGVTTFQGTPEELRQRLQNRP
ncbi:ATP-binding cassette domain-containing protein [Vulcanococcus sp. DEBay_Sum29NL08_54]|uniref:ATP-binding cassette domain-containing protein n=1 Tax=Vulcanococcus sp. DEBay_Sum29NL08_54 TaxID=2806303 RepID=UPI0025DCB210|nr:ATP-binding cassette domain-containing protein [Vulcanococcus sp. DEBay_Sum29NL08_54]